MKTKLLVFGGSGLVGSRFVELNKQSLLLRNKDNFEINAPNTAEVDILNNEKLLKVFAGFNPEVVINFAAFTDVQSAEKERGDKKGFCYKVNVIGAENVAQACKHFGIHLIHISTEYVFDGKKSDFPYTEEDKPNPINWYGQTKYFAENICLESGVSLNILRISMPYAANYEAKSDVARFFLGKFQKGEQILAINDQIITPTFVDDIASALVFAVKAKTTGIYHVAVKNWTTPFNFAKLLANTFGFDASSVKSISIGQYNQGKQVPLLQYSWLDPAKFMTKFGQSVLHTVEESVKLFKVAVDSTATFSI